ncbi:MAG: hypothetical protein KBT47_03075, partial [Armatimonadetes bacterium]|nr:hypothetical protein [Candidatus Hippobium faecium]
QHIDTPVDYKNVKLIDLSSMKEYANAKEYIMEKNSLSENGSRLYVYPMTGTQGYMLVKFDIRSIFGGAK